MVTQLTHDWIKNIAGGGGGGGEAQLMDHSHGLEALVQIHV